MPETTEQLSSTLRSTIDHQIALLEQDRKAALTAAQHRHLPAKLSGLAESLHAMRAFHLADGGAEPGVVFHPLSPAHPPVAPAETNLSEADLVEVNSLGTALNEIQTEASHD